MIKKGTAPMTIADCPHENFFVLSNAAPAQPSTVVCTWCTKPITDAQWLKLHTCIRCMELIPPVGATQRCKNAPDRGPHEFPEPLLPIRAIIAKNRDRSDLAQAIAATKGPQDSVQLRHADGGLALVGPEMSKPGGYRITWMDRNGGPVGHTETASLAKGIYEAMLEGYQPISGDAR